MSKRTFWSNLHDAYVGGEGFTVIFHLKSGKSLNITVGGLSWREPGYLTSTFFEGENIEADRQPVTIPTIAVEAYEIEY